MNLHSEISKILDSLYKTGLNDGKNGTESKPYNLRNAQLLTLIKKYEKSLVPKKKVKRIFNRKDKFGQEWYDIIDDNPFSRGYDQCVDDMLAKLKDPSNPSGLKGPKEVEK